MKKKPLMDTVYLGDVLDLLKQLPDQCVDIVYPRLFESAPAYPSDATSQA